MNEERKKLLEQILCVFCGGVLGLVIGGLLAWYWLIPWPENRTWNW